MGKAYYRRPNIVNPQSGKEIASISFTAYRMTSSTIFLVHSSCHHLLRDFLHCDINPTLLFKLCQVLQVDKDRFGAWEPLSLTGK